MKVQRVLERLQSGWVLSKPGDDTQSPPSSGSSTDTLYSPLIRELQQVKVHQGFPGLRTLEQKRGPRYCSWFGSAVACSHKFTDKKETTTDLCCCCCCSCLCASHLWPAEAQIGLDGPRFQLSQRPNRVLRILEAQGSSLVCHSAFPVVHHTSPAQACPESSHPLFCRTAGPNHGLQPRLPPGRCLPLAPLWAVFAAGRAVAWWRCSLFWLVAAAFWHGGFSVHAQSLKIASSSRPSGSVPPHAACTSAYSEHLR